MNTARINTDPRRGKTYTALCREYECEDYYELIVNAYINGNRNDAIGYFNRLKKEYQKAFLNSAEDYGMYGTRVKELIIQSL